MANPKKRVKLSDDDILNIVRLYQDHSYTQGKLAHMFGVTATYIGMIVRNEVRHAASRRGVLEDRSPNPISVDDVKGKLTEELRAEGFSIEEINIALDQLEVDNFGVPRIPRRVRTQDPYTPDELEDIESMMDSELAEQSIDMDKILALADKFDREEQERLAEQIKVKGAPRKGERKIAAPIQMETLSLEKLKKKAPKNRYIKQAESTPEVKDIICEVLSSLPIDVWDTNLPSILIEKRLLGEG